MRSRTVQGTVAIAATASLALAACGRAPADRSPAARASSPTTRSSSACSTTSRASTRTCPARTRKAAIQLAIDDYKAKYGDKAVAKNIEVVTADHQNKADIANSKAQEMYDRQKADIILDVPNSAAALAVATQAENKKKLYINIGAGTTALTGPAATSTPSTGRTTRASWRAAPPARSPRTAARPGTSSTPTTPSDRT